MPYDVEALFREHHVPLFRYLLRLTADPDLAADATQEAFVRMIEKRPAEGNPRAWLYTVATNYVREATRAGSRHAALAEDAALRIAPETAPTPDERLDARQHTDAVRRALRSLKERDRTILLMREEGFTHREIARAVGTTTGSVGTMIARALDKLADALGGIPTREEALP